MVTETADSTAGLLAIEARGLAKRFVTRHGAVDALLPTDLAVRSGEVLGLLGFSGAGKSTLLRMMNLLEQPSSGAILVGGRDIVTLSGGELRRMRRRIGMIFQQFNLMAQASVLQNVAFSLKIAGVGRAEREHRARDTLALVGLADKAEAYPAQLSGGQRQRVAIGRALINDPEILLCDEATSALDPHTSLSILRFLKQINRMHGTTMVIVTHDINVARYICNRAVIMEKGRIIEALDMRSPAPATPLGRFFLETAQGWTDRTELPGEEA